MKKFCGLFLGILFLSFAMLMAGCSKKQGQAEKDNVNGAPRGYHKEFQEIRVPRVVLQGLFCCCFSQDYFYYVESGDQETIYRQGINESEAETYLQWNREDGEVRGLEAFEDGRLAVLLCRVSNENGRKEWLLQEYDEKKEQIQSVTLFGKLQETDLLSFLACMQEGRTFLRNVGTGAGELLYANDKGELQGVSASLPQIINGVGGTKNKDELLVYNNEGLYVYDGKENCRELLLWNDLSLLGESVRAVWKSEEKLLVLLSDRASGKTQIVTLREKAEGEEDAEQEVLTLATLMENTSLTRAVADFNQTHEECQIKVVRYVNFTANTTQAEIREGITRLCMDLLTENAPDILDLSLIINWGDTSASTVEDLLGKGYVLDLTLFLEQSQKIHRSEYSDKVLQLCSSNGKLAAIPYGVRLDTLIANKDIVNVNEKGGWTVSDFMTLGRSLTEEELLKGLDRWIVLDFCLAPNLSFFVDENARKCYFNSEEFKELLQFAASFPDKGGDYSPLYKEKGAIAWRSIPQVEEVPIYQFRSFGENAVFVGFPTYDGSACQRLGICYDVSTLAICSKCKDTKMAWSFIEDYLATPFFDDQEDHVAFFARNSMLYGIPTNSTMLGRYLEYLKKEGGPLGYTPVEDYLEYMKQNHPDEYIGHPVTDEEEALFYQLMETAEPAMAKEKLYMAMITEEVGAYFAGQKELDEVVNIIQNRMMLYLME